MAELKLKIRISPNASKNEIIKGEDGVKIKITAQPIEGKANKAVVEFLSKEFKIPKSYIEIVKGTTSKEKTILIRCDNEEKINLINSRLN